MPSPASQMAFNVDDGEPLSNFSYSRGLWGPAPSATRAAPFTTSPPAPLSADGSYRSALDAAGTKFADSEAFRNGGIAWGSAASSAASRRGSHALTEPDKPFTQAPVIPDFPRRASVNGPPAHLLSSLTPLTQGSSNPFGTTSIADQYGYLADATRHVELTHRADPPQAEVPPRYKPQLVAENGAFVPGKPILAHTTPPGQDFSLKNTTSPWQHPIQRHAMPPSPLQKPKPVRPEISTPELAADGAGGASLGPRKRVSRKKEWKRGKRIDAPIFEDLRERGKLQIQDVLGHVADVAADQHGSRFIQEHLAQAPESIRDKFFDEALANSLPLMTDVFGNYVIQQLLELGTADQRTKLVQSMHGKILSLSLQMYGCRVVQMAIRYSSEQERVQIVEELRNNVVRCIKDHNGNHVVQKSVECVVPQHVKFIYNSVMDRTLELAKHMYGCRVVQRILEFADRDTKRALLDELHSHVEELTEDRYGNYVIQHIVDNGPAAERDSVISLLLPKVVTLSTHKYASNVIEKCFMKGNAQQRSLIISEILSPQDDGSSAIAVMIRDQYANYVIQKILGSVDGSDRWRLVAAIKPPLSDLKKSSYGKHLASIERLLSDL